MKSARISIVDFFIKTGFFLLFFLVPLLLTPLNYELFEYNKMMATYILATMIISSWVIKMVSQKQILIRRTPLDIPLLLFLLSQVISTVFSIDTHVSLFGYYSRFNGGLISIVTYIGLYYAFVSNIRRENVRSYVVSIISSALLICTYAVAQHLGIDKHIWIQDVQNRVFSTLGQPNWLAAYISVTLLLILGMGWGYVEKVLHRTNSQIVHTPLKERFLRIFYWAGALLFYMTILFTRSRSGFIAAWIGILFFCTTLILLYKRQALKLIGILLISFLALNSYYGFPFAALDRFTLKNITASKQSAPITVAQPPSGTVLETGITDSGNIRKIVWKGALEITKHYPLFGSGVETFAYSYYQFRPIEHNMTSEWDFLYNKAHNEYLNYAATTGLIGLGSYLLLISIFIFWVIKKIIQYLSVDKKTTHLKDVDIVFISALFFGWITILITNFLGFSVVAIQIFFFLIPALCVLSFEYEARFIRIPQKVSETKKTGIGNTVLTIIPILIGLWIIVTISRMWLADVFYARGYQSSRSGDFLNAYQFLKQAVTLNPQEILYYDEISYPSAILSVAAFEQKESTLAAQLASEAILTSNLAIQTSPYNVNFYKTRTRMYHALSEIDQKYIGDSIQALVKASMLSPTDPKIFYNLGVLYGKVGENQKAITALETATTLKPDYRDPWYALALFYKETKQPEKARESLMFILTKIATSDGESIKLLDSLGK